MVWIAIALLTAAALLPLLVVLRRATQARGPRAMAVSLHQAQLAELDRDLVEARILPPEHATAVLEIQRRLLAAAERPDITPNTGSRAPILLTMALVPMIALALYLVGGQPTMPSLPPGSSAIRQQRANEETRIVAILRDKLQTLDPASDQAQQGLILLGNVEQARGNDAAAAQAWRTALAARFNPTLALRTADAATRAEGGLSTTSAALLRQALAAAPPDAPWRTAVENRLKESGL